MKKLLIPIFCFCILAIALVIFAFYGASTGLTLLLIGALILSWGVGYRETQRALGAKKLEKAILDSAKVSVIATDVEGLITHFSSGAEELLGYKSHEMVGKQTPAILHDLDEVVERNKELNAEFGEENTPGFITFVRRVYRDAKDEKKWTYIRKDGTRFPVMLSVTPIYSSKKEIVGFLGVATDISEIENQKELLQKAKDEAQMANRSKSFFLANMSHELRTPLNGILGMSGLLKETKLDEEQRDLNEYIAESSQHLTSIINDILDFTKIEMGGIEIKKKSVDLNNFNKTLEEAMISLNKMESVKCSFIVEGEIPKVINIDPIRLNQVLMNLIGNAFKFTKEGKVEIKCAYKSGNLIYQIEDTGIGIEEEKISHLFSAFTQESEHMRREFIGTGLGLSIVRELTQLMEGSVSVMSKKGLGSKFLISLPAPIGTMVEKEEEDLTNIRLDGVKILLVEDNEINQKLIVKTLEKIGAKVNIVINGQLAVDEVYENNYDLILMDYQLPIMDGVTATKKIREFNNDIPIVALTANAFEEDRRECLLAGMNEFLAKPISPQKLKKALHKLL
jgi:PAS domain S-box-containing protein